MARNRHRNVSKDNYFHPDNDPPEDRRRQGNTRILEKPGRLDLKQLNTTKLPLAGKMSNIGEQILFQSEGVKAAHVITGNWGYLLDKSVSSRASSIRPGMKKITSFDPFNYVEQPSYTGTKRTSQNDNTMDRLNRALKNGRITPMGSRSGNADTFNTINIR